MEFLLGEQALLQMIPLDFKRSSHTQLKQKHSVHANALQLNEHNSSFALINLFLISEQKSEMFSLKNLRYAQ